MLLSQLCERYHRARVVDGRAIVHGSELLQVRGTLAECEKEVGKLHALASSSQAMMDEAWSAFGLDPPDRHFAVLCDYDTPSLSVAPLDDLICEARANGVPLPFPSPSFATTKAEEKA